ncbi:MAG TPA: hypothetical protein VK003_17010, partial [Oceanobacillus sp.]|nr:hypothetical protein [Oceanobacillus sp.]
DVAAGEIIETCLTNSYTDVVSTGLDLAWSADSRYLASYGLLADEENATTGTVYIYDVATGAIYTVFTGDAELIDWTHSETTKTGQ